MVKAKGKAGAKSAGFCMYIGPSIVGTIQQARILYGDKQDALAQISAAVEKYPLIATLVIPGDQVSEARIKVKNTRQSALCELSQAGRPEKEGGVTIEAWRICAGAENERFDARCR